MNYIKAKINTFGKSLLWYNYRELNWYKTNVILWKGSPETIAKTGDNRI